VETEPVRARTETRPVVGVLSDLRHFAAQILCAAAARLAQCWEPPTGQQHPTSAGAFSIATPILQASLHR